MAMVDVAINIIPASGNGYGLDLYDVEVSVGSSSSFTVVENIPEEWAIEQARELAMEYAISDNDIWLKTKRLSDIRRYVPNAAIPA